MPHLIEPTRKLSAKERREFNRIVASGPHLTPADGRVIADLAGLYVRRAEADADARKNKTIEQPIINRSTGNIVGTRQVRNPAFVTLRETSVQIGRLERALLLLPSQASKRLRLLTKQAQAAAENEQQHADEYQRHVAISDEDIQGLMDYWRSGRKGLIDRPDDWRNISADPELLRQAAIDLLRSDAIASRCAPVVFSNLQEYEALCWLPHFKNDYPYLTEKYLDACGCKQHPETITFVDGDSVTFDLSTIHK